LIAFYCTEALTPIIRSFVEDRDQPVLINALQELEFRNGLRQKVLRREISPGDLTRSLRLFEDDCVTSKIYRKPVAWPVIYERAEVISRHRSPKQACRSFDLMHVAVAVVSKVRKFATIDSAQAKLARAAGLMPVEFSEA